MPYPKHICELKPDEDPDTLRLSTFRGKLFIRFRNLFLISEKNFRSYLFLRSKGAIHKEIRQQKASKHWYIVHPFSLLRLYWEIFIYSVFYVFALFLSFRTAFFNSFMAGYYAQEGQSLHGFRTIAHIDLSLSLVCICDMFGLFFTGYYDTEMRETVMTPREIRKHYFLPTFVLDVSCSLPLDSLVVVFGGVDTYAKMSHVSFIFLELYNMYRLVRFRKVVTYTFQGARQDVLSLLLFRLLLAVFVYVLLVHWLGAVSIIVPEMIHWKTIYLESKRISWISEAAFLEMSFQGQYVTMVMKAVENSIGANESAEGLYSAEDYVIALLSIFVGRMYFLFLLLTIMETVTASTAMKAKLRLILDQLQVYMKQKDLPVSLKKRMSRFYLYRFQAHYFSNRAMLGRLTESLRKEISMFTCQRLLHNTEVFQSVPKKVLTEFVMRMNREMYFPKDVIIQGNTFGECMYFICSGSVAVETLSEKEICTLGDGDFFGEIALIAPDRRRIATVTALTITEVYRLEYSDYSRIIDVYPDVYNRLEKYALERYRTTVLVEGGQDWRRRNVSA